MTSANPKTMMGTYELVRRLGVGGMGEVWLARQRGAAGFSREVAIKRLLPQAMEQQDVVAMFIEEAQITGRLRHPNVVNVIELGAAESGELYLVLEYVDGTGLHKLLRDASTRPGVGSALAVGREIALALNAAHSLTDEEGKDLGLVHRDVTPSNVMLDRYGHVKLMDFGIAKVRAKSNQTEAGIIKGKIAYLAPEQLRGSVDPRSDLFSLGLVVWEMIAGQQARSGSSDAVMMAKVALDEIPSIATVVPDLPPAVVAAVDKACHLDPDQRYQTGDEMAAAMLVALQALPERNSMESAREDLAAAVKAALKRDGEAVGGTTNASRTVDAERPLALTLHSLVMQDGTQTISRPLSSLEIKVIAPPDARTSSGTQTRTRVGRRKRSAAFPIAAIFGSIAVVGGVVALRGRTTAASSNRGTADTRTVAALNGLPGTDPTPPVTPPTPPTPEPGASADAGAAATNAGAGADGGGVAARTTPGGRRPGGRTGGQSNARTISQVDPSTPATLGVAARPWANVTIDGRSYGETPVAPVSLPPGTHTVVLVNPELDRRVTRRLQLAPGESRRLIEDMNRAE